mmetsp:Transcript_123081/g.192266  ORF Transcript_123081/g.192266 Transcript_123081/m.192266 type:complete len:125 (-) Transcript_123081:646-1020(-)
MSVKDIPMMEAISEASLRKLASLDLKSLTSHEAFDFTFSLVSLSWSLAFVAQASGDTSAGKCYTSNRMILSSLLGIGRELDDRVAKGDSSVFSGSLLSWVCKVAAAAQGGHESKPRVLHDLKET